MSGRPTVRTVLSWSLLGLACLLALAIVSGWWFVCREHRDWASAFASVQKGMTIQEVRTVYEPFTGRDDKLSWQTNLNQRDLQKEGAPAESVSYVHYFGPNHWRYRIYLDPQETVVFKQKWWD